MMIPWFHQHWKTVVLVVLLPLGILYLIARAYRLLRPVRPVVVSSTEGTTAAIEEKDREVDRKVESAREEAEVDIKRIEEQHKEKIERLDEQQRIEYQALREQGPSAVTQWLLRVGKGEGR